MDNEEGSRAGGLTACAEVERVLGLCASEERAGEQSAERRKGTAATWLNSPRLDNQTTSHSLYVPSEPSTASPQTSLDFVRLVPSSPPRLNPAHLSDLSRPSDCLRTRVTVERGVRMGGQQVLATQELTVGRGGLFKAVDIFVLLRFCAVTLQDVEDPSTVSRRTSSSSAAPLV